MECFVDLLKYLTLPANVNAHSLDIIMDMNIPRSVKDGTQRQRSTDPGTNDVGWKCFLIKVITKTTLLPYSSSFWNHQKVENTTSILFDMLSFTFVITYVRLSISQKFKLSPFSI